MSFYSKLVRLEATTVEIQRVVWDSFYSKLVRLEEWEGTEECTSRVCFYSKLVRLEVNNIFHKGGALE